MGIWRADHRLVVDAGGAALLIRVRNVAAMILAAASGATDAIGYLALGQVFTSAMTGNLVLLGIGVAHRDGERVGRVLLSLLCFIVGAGLGARIAHSPEPDDPVWPAAVTRALAVETVIFVSCYRQSAAWPWCARRGHSERCDATVWSGPQHNVSFRVADHLGRLAGDRAPAPRHPPPSAGAGRPGLRCLTRGIAGAACTGVRTCRATGRTGSRALRCRLASSRVAPDSERAAQGCSDSLRTSSGRERKTVIACSATSLGHDRTCGEV
jgi:Protein of unknown function (DUF1275)